MPSPDGGVNREFLSGEPWTWRGFGRRWGETEVAEDAHESLEAAVHGYDLPFAGRGGGEVDKVGRRVEQRER